MHITATVSPLRQAMQRAERDFATGVTGGMKDATKLLVTGLRSDMVAAGLGTRLANTWRGKTYPSRTVSLHPTAYAWSKAPEIASFYDADNTIIPFNGHKYVAIPTKNVPRGHKGRRLSVPEVEKLVGKLILFKNRKGHLLAFADFSKTPKGIRRSGVKRDLVQMFTFVEAVRGRKRTDVATVANRVAAQIPDLIAARLA